MSKKSASLAKKRQQERQRQRQRQRTMLIVFALVVVALGVVGLMVLSTSPAEAPIPEGAETKYEGIERSYTEAGYPRLGDPDAPVRLVEFSSFSCEFCAVFHEQTFPRLLERIQRGEINFTFIPLNNGSIPNAPGANRTAMCAGEQNRFWEMSDTLFDWHRRFGNTAFSSNRLQTGIANLGLNVDTFNQCFNSDRISNLLQAAIVQGQGVGTPYMRINDVPVGLTLEEIEAEIEARLPDDFVPLDLRQPAETQDDATPEVTPDVAPESTPEMAAEATAEATAEMTAEAPIEMTAEATAEIDAEATAEATEPADD
jgi:protein-disulfide isomerase